MRKHLKWLARCAGMSVVLIGGMALIFVMLCMNQTEETVRAGADATARPYVQPQALDGVQTQDVARFFPYPGAVLTGGGWTLAAESAYDQRALMQTCRVLKRVYEDAQGIRVTVYSATPAAYMTTYEAYAPSMENYAMPDGMTATLLEKGEKRCLLMRAGETVYALETEAEKEALLAAAAELSFE